MTDISRVVTKLAKAQLMLGEALEKLTQTPARAVSATKLLDGAVVLVEEAKALPEFLQATLEVVDRLPGEAL